MSVYKRFHKDGKTFTWYSSLTINGKHYQKRLPTARTKGQAIEAERQFLRDIHDGTHDKAQAMVFKEFVEKRYKLWAKTNKRSYETDEMRLKPLLAHFGKKRLSQISPFDVERYKIERRDTKTWHDKQRAAGTVNRELCLLSAIFRLAVTSGEVEKNPVRKVRMLQEENKRERYLSPEEEERLLRQLVGDREHLRPIVILAIHTGMRAGEILTLEWQQIDFARGTIHLDKTKSGKARTIPMNSRARQALESLKRESAYCFANPETGKPYTTIKTAWKAACEKAKIEGLRFHDLRHTFGTRAADAGVPIVAIAEVMGHSSIQTTMRYAHATDEGKRRAVEAIEQVRYVAATREEKGRVAKQVSGWKD